MKKVNIIKIKIICICLFCCMFFALIVYIIATNSKNNKDNFSTNKINELISKEEILENKNANNSIEKRKYFYRNKYIESTLGLKSIPSIVIKVLNGYFSENEDDKSIKLNFQPNWNNTHRILVSSFGCQINNLSILKWQNSNGGEVWYTSIDVKFKKIKSSSSIKNQDFEYTKKQYVLVLRPLLNNNFDFNIYEGSIEDNYEFINQT